MPKKRLEKLKAGYGNFRKKYFEGKNKLFDSLKTGQSPETLVIACSDSRVDPTIIMDCEPGELFVVRNVANLVPPCESCDTGYHGTSAALEFGVTGLKVKNIIILGHSMCGGINSLFHRDENSSKNRSFVDKWMEILGDISNDKSLNESDLSKNVDKCSKLAIIKSLKNLESFDFVKERVDSSELAIHGLYFDIRNGKIESFDKESKKFIDFV